MQDARHAELADEVAYVKTLAEEGRNAPLVGGVMYVIWGGLMGAASLFAYARGAAGVDLGAFLNGAGPWTIAFVCGWALSFWFGARRSRKPGALTIGNRTANAAWLGVGIFMSAFWLAGLAFHDNLEGAGLRPFALFTLMFPLAFGLYGVAFLTTATAARLDWMRGFAVASWLFSVATLYFAGDARQLLLGAIGSLVCAMAPGLVLMRREPSDIV